MWPSVTHINRQAIRGMRYTGLLSLSLLFASVTLAESVEGKDFDCLMEPKTRVMVGASTQGVIQKIHVRRGDYVEKGQLLATLDARLEQAELKYARMRSEMNSEIQAREADVRLAQLTQQRVSDLYRKNLAPAQQRDEAQAALEVARMSLQQAKDTKRLNEQEYARVREVVAQHVIRSPISGVVVDQVAFPGEFIYENPLMVIAQVDPLKVEAILPARYFGRVSNGMLSKVYPEIELDKPLEAPVASVDQVIDSASGTFVVHLELPNPDNAVPGGQRCRLAFGDVDEKAMADRKAASR